MFGIGTQELLVFLAIILVMFVPGIIGVGVLLWFVLKNNAKRTSTDE